MNRVFKKEKNKEFVCRQCSKFLDSSDLKNGKCPICNNDEDLFLNIED